MEGSGLPLEAPGASGQNQEPWAGTQEKKETKQKQKHLGRWCKRKGKSQTYREGCQRS